MRTPTTLAAVALALLLAGCGDPPKSNDDQVLAPAFDDLDLEATSTTGVIRGVVVDASIKPIAGALVKLSAGGETTTSDSGAFGFDGLDAATYFLSVSKLGFKATQQSVDVEAGVTEPQIVKVLLEADPSSIPFYVQQSYHGFISCGFKAANYVFDADDCDPRGVTGHAARDDSAPWFFLDAKPTYYQSEMIWKATQSFSESLVTIQFACSTVDDCGNNDYRLCNTRGVSPLVCRNNLNESIADTSGSGHGIDEAGLGTENLGYQVAMFANCNPQCVIGAVGAGLALDQPFDVFNTIFYGYEPPADWLFVQDSQVPGPA